MTVATLGIPRQNSDAWCRARAGKVTGSRFGDLSRTKSGDGWGTGAISYCYELIAERLLLDNPDWQPPPELKTAPIEWGNANEPFARTSYIYLTGNDVLEYGFLPHPTHKQIGVSLDGVIGAEGSIEIKCPFCTREHVRTLHTGKIPAKYVPQVQGGLWVSGRQWCDFVSFDNRVAERLTTCVVRVARDEEYIGKLAAKVFDFASFVDQTEKEVRNAA